MEEIYYADRPSVPVTQQSVVHLDAILEHAVIIESQEIDDNYYGSAVEVRNSDGEIYGTLVYFSGVTHAQLTGVVESSEGEEDVEVEAEVFGGEEVGVNELTATPQTQDEFNAESKLIDLELELAETKRIVQDIEADIAAIEKESFID
mgnify:CR=1 FL=1